VRIALISDPMKMDYPESIQKIYEETRNSVANSIAAAIKNLDFEFEHLEATNNLDDKVKKFKPNLVFNRSNLENHKKGISFTPFLLDKLEIPYTGPDAKNCVIAFNKCLTKKILESLDIRTSKFVLIDDPTNIKIPDNMSYPLFIKPIMGGCSLGIEDQNLVFSRELCEANSKYLIEYIQQPVLVEEFLGGREFTVGIFGNDRPEALPILEFINHSEEAYQFRSFNSKMVAGKQEKISCPALLSKKEESEIVNLALKTYEAIGCRDYARIDIRNNDEGIPFVLEVNAFPSLIPGGSSFADMAETVGLSFTDLIKEILTIACKRNDIDIDNEIIKQIDINPDSRYINSNKHLLPL